MKSIRSLPLRDTTAGLRAGAISSVFLLAWFWSWKGVGLCLFHRITSLQCPGCGMTRSFHALTHGHIGEALECNLLSAPLFFAAGVVLVLDIAYLASGIRIHRGLSERQKTVCALAGLFLVLSYGIVRNVLSLP